MIAVGGGVLCNRCNVKGFGFRPTEKELVDHHLIPKILDPDSDQHYIADVDDLTQFEPSELFGITQKNPDDREGYFFWSPTYNENGKIIRKGKNGFWSETGKKVSIDSAAAVDVDAKKRTFVFLQGVHPGTRTAWFIYLFELSRHHHQDKKDIFLCKLVEHKQKDRHSINKRKAEHNEQETSAEPKRATKDNSLRKKAKVSSAKEAQLDDQHNNNIPSSEVLQGSRSLPSEPDSSILTGELTPQSHHLPSKVLSENISNNMLAGDHPCSPGRLHPSNEFLVNIPDFSDNRHHLPSNSINISTCIGMQPHFPSSSSEEISNGDLQYNEQRQEGSQLSCYLPLDLESELLQMSHHLPSNCKESMVGFDAYQKNQLKLPPLEGSSWDDMDEDANHLFSIGLMLKALLEQPQPSATPEVHGCNELPPSSDLSKGLHPSNGFLGDIQDFSDNQQCHHLPSNSINSISTYVGMQPNYHFPSSTSEDISNGDPLYNEQRQESCSWDCIDEDANHSFDFRIEELKALLEQSQPSTTVEVHGCNELPPSSDLSRGTDKFQDQPGYSEEDDTSF